MARLLLGKKKRNKIQTHAASLTYALDIFNPVNYLTHFSSFSRQRQSAPSHLLIPPFLNPQADSHLLKAAEQPTSLMRQTDGGMLGMSFPEPSTPLLPPRNAIVTLEQTGFISRARK